MRFRCLAMALMVCGLALMAGCPLGIDLGLGSGLQSLLGTYLGTGQGSGSNGILDGGYVGDFSATAELWYGGELQGQPSGGGEASATFSDGKALADSGRALQIGDVEDDDWGLFTVSREVYDVETAEGAYQVSYDAWAQWGSVPLTGTEFITFTANADGTITMFDKLVLTSTYEYDGGAWMIYADASGTLASSQGSGYSSGEAGSGYPSGDAGSGYPSGDAGSGNPWDDILGKKSGKIRH